MTQPTSADIAALIEAINAASIHLRSEWTAATTFLDGTVKHAPAENEEHAALIADSITTHVASLNEPTREHNGVTSAAVVTREVRGLPGGTQIISPWRQVREGRVLTFGDEGR